MNIRAIAECHRPRLLRAMMVNGGQPMPMRYLAHEELQRRGISLSKRQLRRLEARAEFPARVRLSGSRIAWIEREIDEWCEARNRAREAA